MFLRSRPWLIEDFRNGEREALTQIYRAYVRELDKYVRALACRSGYPELGQVSTVSDVLQEVFTRAFSPAARRAYDSTQEYGPYLRTIARNCFIDVARRRGRELLKAPEQVVLDLDSQYRLEPSWSEPRVRAVLVAYVDALPLALRGVYERRFLIGQSQSEACEALGLSRAQLRTGENQLRRGLRRAVRQAGLWRQALAGPFDRVFPPADAAPELLGVQHEG
jgi:RNA polymerase sigma factor (sigma-70 family)